MEMVRRTLFLPSFLLIIIEPTICDTAISFCYILLFWAMGTLPWMEMEDEDDILKAKEEFDSHIPKALSPNLSTWFSSSLSSSFIVCIHEFLNDLKSGVFNVDPIRRKVREALTEYDAADIFPSLLVSSAPSTPQVCCRLESTKHPALPSYG